MEYLVWHLSQHALNVKCMARADLARDNTLNF